MEQGGESEDPQVKGYHDIQIYNRGIGMKKEKNVAKQEQKKAKQEERARKKQEKQQ